MVRKIKLSKRSTGELILFFILSLAFPWAIWGTTILESWGIISYHIPQSLAFWIGLNLATLGTILASRDRVLLQDIVNRLTLWRIPGIWYFLALGMTGTISLAAILVFKISGITTNNVSNQSIWSFLGLLLFQIFFFLLTEELAWRGYALPALMSRYNLLTASLILGVFWGIWHLPLFFITGSFHSMIPFGGFFISTIAMSILVSWIFAHTKGSILLAAIFHASTDITISLTGVMEGTERFWIFVMLQSIFAALILWLDRSHFTQAEFSFLPNIYSAGNNDHG
jgi:uncharacterized protein